MIFVFRASAFDDGIEGRRIVGRGEAQYRRRLVHDLHQHLGDVLPVKRDLTGKQLEENRAYREHIRPLVDVLLPHRLLGRHVVRGADRGPEGGELGSDLHLQLDRSEIQNPDDVAFLGLNQEDVVGFEVSVDDPEGVGVVQRLGKLGGDARRPRKRLTALAAEPLAELLSLEELHREVPRTVPGLPEIEDPDDVRVLELSGRLVLPAEALDRDVIAGDLRVQHFDGHVEAVRDAARFIHPTHRPVSDESLDTESADLGTDAGILLSAGGHGPMLKEPVVTGNDLWHRLPSRAASRPSPYAVVPVGGARSVRPRRGSDGAGLRVGGSDSGSGSARGAAGLAGDRRVLEPPDLRDANGPDPGHGACARRRAPDPATCFGGRRRSRGPLRQATWLVATGAMVAALINWGLGLVVGALFARAVGERIAEPTSGDEEPVYPLLCAAGYAGLLCWHGGLSGSAPLMMTRPANVEPILGPDAPVLDLSTTIFSPLNLVTTGGMLVGIPLLAAAMAPSRATLRPPSEAAPRRQDSLGGLQNSPFVTALAVIPLALACVVELSDRGVTALDPNTLNLIVLTLGLTLHGRIPAYLEAASEATRGASGILLQFPFYAGIMGVLRETGLAETFAASLTQLAGPLTLGPLIMLSAGLLNLLIPSGGGQWAVQGPVAMAAASRLHVPAHTAVLSVAYGDQLTNMIQPFWALPLLAITGVKPGDILGFSSVLMVAGLVWCGVCLTASRVLLIHGARFRRWRHRRFRHRRRSTGRCRRRAPP